MSPDCVGCCIFHFRSFCIVSFPDYYYTATLILRQFSGDLIPRQNLVHRQASPYICTHSKAVDIVGYVARSGPNKYRRESTYVCMTLKFTVTIGSAYSTFCTFSGRTACSFARTAISTNMSGQQTVCTCTCLQCGAYVVCVCVRACVCVCVYA